MPARRSWIPLSIRVVFYTAIFLLFALGESNANELVRGITGGVIMADLVTWFARAIIKIRKYLQEFALDAIINIIVVAVFIRWWDIPFPAQGENMAMGFMAFLIACPIKAVWYVLEEMNEETCG
jgi:nicotinamide riboside transporter PnuC